MADGWIGVVGTLSGVALGSFVSWRVTTWSLRKNDELTRHRERQRVDRQHLRGLLVARYEKQRAAIRLYDELLRGSWIDAQLVESKALDVKWMIREAFEQPSLEEAATEALNRFLNTEVVARSELDRREGDVFLGTMVILAQQTRDSVELPPVPDWHAAHAKALATSEHEARSWLLDVGIDPGPVKK